MSNEGKIRRGSLILWIVLFLLFIGVGFGAKLMFSKVITHDRSIDVETLRAEVKQIHELATLEYDYREIVTKEKKGAMSNMFIATFDGTIKAGINLEEVEYDVKNPGPESDDPPEVMVYVPDAKILSHEDSNPNTLYEEGYKSKGVGKERNAKIKEKKKEKQQEFIKAGNLDDAKTKAEEVIKEFILSAYGEDVVVTFQDAQ